MGSIVEYSFGGTQVRSSHLQGQDAGSCCEFSPVLQPIDVALRYRPQKDRHLIVHPVVGLDIDAATSARVPQQFVMMPVPSRGSRTAAMTGREQHGNSASEE